MLATATFSLVESAEVTTSVKVFVVVIVLKPFYSFFRKLNNLKFDFYNT
jgi:hypothetical protein